MAAAATIKAPAFRALNLGSAVAAAPVLAAAELAAAVLPEGPAEEVVVGAGPAVNKVDVAVLVNVDPLVVQVEVLAVAALTTVEPDWLCVRDRDCEARSGRRVLHRNEAGEEAAFERMAGIPEGGLGHSVIFGKEVELDCGANLGCEAGRVVFKAAVGNSNFNRASFLGADRGSCDGSKAKEGAGELHCDLLFAGKMSNRVDLRSKGYR
ncbi:hypothetical protein TOPH_04408 [Tolypocladium ophioglossoides CBS 100239]|uniref:Uncharacterized protein n=1 Tax=Tolypocladium ophioglossoides (strain CBS 100239) TaxID=1163406 RepID=A0A0L0NAF3_TOLOC|nr:hypothetical protein TOPH_04408 [Tolypocladium ophioglossoides CBS 100239]